MAETKVAPKKLDVLVIAEKGVNFEDALKLAGEKGLVLASNKRIDHVLMSGEWKALERALPAWTGTMTGCEEPDTALGKTIGFTDTDSGLTWIFPVPAKFQGETDACLVVEHPHFIIKADGKIRTIIVDDEENVKLLRDFPVKMGWYATSAEGIPFGAQIDKISTDARHMYSIGKMVSPVARYFDGFAGYPGGRDVLLDIRPSYHLGVIVKAREAGAPEKSDEITKQIEKRKLD